MQLMSASNQALLFHIMKVNMYECIKKGLEAVINVLAQHTSSVFKGSLLTTLEIEVLQTWCLTGPVSSSGFSKYVPLLRFSICRWLLYFFWGYWFWNSNIGPHSSGSSLIIRASVLLDILYWISWEDKWLNLSLFFVIDPRQEWDTLESCVCWYSWYGLIKWWIKN